MSSKRRSLPRKKPGRSAHDEIDEELPVLEPVVDEGAELPVLEPVEEVVDEGPVKVACGASDDAAFDRVLTVDVPAMDKAAVPAAVAPSLERTAKRHGQDLRRRRVLVRFTGEAMIGSAVKDVVATALKPFLPGSIVMRRGFGDEKLHEAPVPTLAVQTTTEGVDVAVVVDTGELETADLPILLPVELQKLAAGAAGKRFALTFRGAAKADAATRGLVATTLRAAGAHRIAIGARVLFDQELVDAVQTRADGAGVVLTIVPFAEPALTEEALALFAAERAGAVAGKPVRIWFAKDVKGAEIGAAVAMCRDAGAVRIALGEGSGEDVVWPFLVRCEAGREVVLRLDPAGRSRAGVLAALRRESPEHADAARGKNVVVDWPAGFALDAEVEGVVLPALVQALQPARLACTIGGELREPFHPTPCLVAAVDGRQTLRVDLDAGKPAELLRAFERRVAAMRKAWHGQSVRVVLDGAAAPSRSLVRSICAAIEAAGAMRLEVEDHGAVDVLLPAMLTITRAADGRVRIAALAGDRTPAQQRQAMARELEGAELTATTSVSVVPSPLEGELIAALVEKGVASVFLDGPQPVRVHPPLFAAPIAGGATKAKTATLRAAPTGDVEADVRQALRELPALLPACRGRTVTLQWPGAAVPPAVAAALVEGGVGTLLHDQGGGGTLQLHPPIEPMPVAPETAPADAAPAAVHSAAAAAPASPQGAAVAIPAGIVTVLGRKDEGVPPLAILGVETAQGPAPVEAALLGMSAAFRGRAILLVLRNDGVDVPARIDSEVLQAARRIVAAAAAATLVFRGPDAQGRPHFQVVHSTLRALPIGAAFGDPRKR